MNETEEIRLKIAKLKGWEQDKIYQDLFYETLPDGYRETHWLVVDQNNWPENIADAWELLDELRENHFSVKLLGWDHTDDWYVIMHHRQGHDENIPDDEIRGDTAPLAICKAWIAWKEAQK